MRWLCNMQKQNAALQKISFNKILDDSFKMDEYLNKCFLAWDDVDLLIVHLHHLSNTMRRFKN